MFVKKTEALQEFSALGLENYEITGIFVKSISKGSAADMCGKLRLNDQIIEVDGRTLQGYTNHQAVEVLRNTGKVVKLRLARYLRGVKYEQLKQAIFTGEYCVPATTQAQVHEPKVNTLSHLGNLKETIQKEQLTDEKDSLILDSKKEADIQNLWRRLLSPDHKIIVAQITKFKEGGGLGISLEGTVDVEDGKEVRPHHYIGSILSNGPVGRNGKLCVGDELLEVNGKRLLGLNHREVVQILKELPKLVYLVCARHPHPPTKDFHMSPLYHSTPKKTCGHCAEISRRKTISTRLVKAKSDGYLAMGLSLVSSIHTTLSKLRSRSLEPLASLATWSSEPHIVELIKGDRGLGFSILDYQDPMNLNETVIVVRSLVPGGAAQQDGRLIPGDRLLFVNNINLENASLETAVHALQGAPKGLVRIGIAKPLPCPESNQNSEIPLNESSTGELLSENITKSVYMSSGFEFDQKYDDQLRRISNFPLRQTSLTPSSLLSGGFTSSKSTPLSSPAFSPSSRWDIDIPPLPSALERIVRIKKGTDSLGLSVELVEKGINGMLVKSIAQNSAIEKDGNLAIGDYVLSVNNESMKKITKSQARAILKRAELLSTDIIIKYVPGPDAAVYHQSALMALQHDRESPSIILPRQLSPRIFPKYYRSPIFHSRLPEDINNGELSEESIVRSLPLDSHEDNLSQMLSPCAPTSEGLSTIPTPSSFSTDFSELKRLEDTSQSEDDERKDFMMDEESQNDLSQEQVSEETEEKTTERTISPSFAEIRAVFLAKSAPCKPFVPLKPTTTSSSVQSLENSEEIKDSKDVDSFVSSDDTEYKNSLLFEKINNTVIQWGPKRLVEIWRESDSGIGISIVKGVKQNDDNSDTAHSGIFIKNVLDDSPAGQTGAIRKGDKILEVDDIDITTMEYEKVIDLIRNSTNPVKFLLQSLVEMETIKKSPELHIEEEKETSPIIEPFIESHSIIPNPEFLAPRRLSDRIEILSTSIAESDEEEEMEDELDERQIQGKIYSKEGLEIDRASAAHIKLSSEDLTEEEDEFGYSMKKIKKKYGDMNGELIVVELQKGPNGLGLSLAGNKDRTKMSVFVCGVHPSGNAAKDGRIKIGDELLEVNGLVMYGRCHLNASAMIKGLPGSVYKMILIRKEDILDEMAVKPITQFPLYLQEETQEERFARYGSVKKVSTRKGPQGLGIMIIEGKHAEVGQGIFISDIQEGSPAKQAGLNVGDMILAVNQTELIGADYDTAAGVLKQIDGSINIVIANPNKSLASDNKEENKGVEGSEKLTKRVSKREKRNATSKFGHFPVKSSIINCRTRTSGGTKSHTFSLSSHFSHYTSSRTSHFPKLPTLPSSSLLDGTSTLPEEPVEPPADPKTCEIKPGQETTIEINKEKTGLGLNIVGGNDTPLNAIIIHEVYPDGAAATDGRLQPGDQIVELNGENFRNVCHEYAITALQKSPSIVQLTVYREPGSNHGKKYDTLQVELYKKSGRGLGLSIVGRKNGPGVFISEVVKGGVAEADGRLMQGDQILEVNNIDLKNSSQEHAAAILKTVIGKVSLKIGRLKASSRHNSPGTPDSIESLGIRKVNESKSSEALQNISLRKLEQESSTRRHYIF
ncbi:multiple PDZ domain protein-like isoform X3 [Centruroides vittatus]|uniref:multiple PDZ domain protein-like isoform X3 n=1 Tax=Centruroides vittatus TaxID=120091 RepID=UPI003510987B